MKLSKFRTILITAVALSLTGAVFGVAPVHAKKKRPKVCTTTAKFQYKACVAEAFDDYYTTRAACGNDPDEGKQCVRDAVSDRREAGEECRDQREARRDFCEEIGETPYDPDMDALLFQDPRNPSNPNPYFPLDIGNFWVYEEGDERIEIEILDATKRIAGIDCIVYRDIVTSDGLLVEATDDWFGIRTNGNVEYCGEEVKDYEHFEGDDPQAPELTEIEGRFKAGEELAKSGTAFLGDPVPGTSYRQEWDPGNAEDIGKVLSNSYAYGQDPELDELVPEALADLMCSAGDCVVIQDGSTLDPDAFERKYYAPGIGKFLEVKPEEGEFVPLIECNFDPLCASLPVE